MWQQRTPENGTETRGRRLSALAAATAAVATLSMVGGVANAAAPSASSSGVYHGKVARVCATPRAHHASCLAMRQVTPNEPVSLQTHAVVANVTPAGYGPTQLRSAYALTASGSASQTVAIVDAQDDPNAEPDLATYRSQYGLPSCTTANGCFRKVNQNGAASPLPAPDSGWAGEISLDLDMVSAICPNCHILLVEANSASDLDLYTAENRAVALGAKYVSNSWGGGEYSGQTSDDAYFNHPGVAITASSGDDGTGPEYPATSRYVTAVGGTHLVTAANARGWAETAWNGAGSGCSAFDTQPSFQVGITTSCARRAEADVSAVADPATGVAVYQTYGASGWNVYGGTSVAAPIIASVYALAGTPGASDSPNSYPYAHRGNLNDVTSGNNGTCGAPLCTAGTGWDGPTGLGTPNGTAAFASAPSSSVTVNNPGNRTGTVGTPVGLTVTASGGTGSYTWTATGLPAGLSISSAGVISGTPTTAGTSTVTVTARDTNGATGSASFTYTISTGSSGCATGQKLGNPGFESGNTVWSASPAVIGQNGPSEPAHTGTWNAWLDGYGTTHTDTVSQSVTIPAGCTASTLSFYLHIDTAETTTTTQFDKLTVTLGTTTLGTFSNLNHVTGYQQHSFPIGSFAGQTVTLKFSGTEDSSLQTSFVLDDTAVNAA